MKHLIPAGAAILVLGLCGLAPRVEKPSGTAKAIRLPEPALVAERARAAAGASAPEWKESPAVPAATTPATLRMEGGVPVPEIREMRGVLCARLELTELQAEVVSDALQARAQELRDCHESYRRNGVFLPWEYGRQLERMKETWYRAIDRVLDSRQHELFDVLVKDGYFRPDTSFSADLSEMIVVR